jgi:hypothetical protein
LAEPQTMISGETFGQLAFLWEYYGTLIFFLYSFTKKIPVQNKIIQAMQSVTSI